MPEVRKSRGHLDSAGQWTASQPLSCVLVHFRREASGLISLQNKINPQPHLSPIASPHFSRWIVYRGSRPALSSFVLTLLHGGTQRKSALCPRVRVLHHLLPQTDFLTNRVHFHFLFSYFYSTCRDEYYTLNAQWVQILLPSMANFFSLC